MRFRCQLQDSGKGGSYMRKRFKTVTEREIEREKGYKGGMNGKFNRGCSPSIGQDSS